MGNTTYKVLNEKKDRRYHKNHVYQYQAIRERLIQEIKKKKHDYYAKVVTRNPKAPWSEN